MLPWLKREQCCLHSVNGRKARPICLGGTEKEFVQNSAAGKRPMEQGRLLGFRGAPSRIHRGGLACAGGSEKGVLAVLVRVLLPVLRTASFHWGPSARIPAVREPGPGTEASVPLHSPPAPPARPPGTLGRSFAAPQASRFSSAEWTSPPLGWS